MAGNNATADIWGPNPPAEFINTVNAILDGIKDWDLMPVYRQRTRKQRQTLKRAEAKVHRAEAKVSQVEAAKRRIEKKLAATHVAALLAILEKRSIRLSTPQRQRLRRMDHAKLPSLSVARRATSAEDFLHRAGLVNGR